MNNQYGFDPSANPNGDYLWDEKGLIGFSQNNIASTKHFPDNYNREESEVEFMDIVRDQDGTANFNKKKKKNMVDEMNLGIKKKKKDDKK